nr:unnamed protein product [Callosobruchus analis]
MLELAIYHIKDHVTFVLNKILTTGLSCTLCKQTGHLASKCPCQPIQSDIVEKNPEISTMNAPLTTTEEPGNTPINNSPPIPSDTNIVTEAPQQTKRQLSANSDHNEPDPAPTDAIAKKLKTSEEIEDTLKTAEDFINSQFNITKMNITEVADMIENAHKSKDIITTVKNYTNDIPHLIKFLSDLHTHICNTDNTDPICHVQATIQTIFDVVDPGFGLESVEPYYGMEGGEGMLLKKFQMDFKSR